MFSAVESTDVNECNEPEDVTEDVKENWDDSEEEAEGEVEMKGEEEEVEASVVASPTGRSTHAVVAQEAAVADEGDSEVSEESENSSESEDETLPAPERQRARVCRRLEVAGAGGVPTAVSFSDPMFLYCFSLETQAKSKRRNKFGSP